MTSRILIVLLSAILLPACPLKIGRVEALWLLWLLPLTILFVVWSFRSKTRVMRRFASADMLVRIASGVSRPRQVLKAAMVVAALTFAVLALTEPKYGFTWEDVKREGVDIVVTLDVSDSMLVEDVEAGGALSRLERAKREITDLLRILEGDRVGLVAFAGTAFLECPLTLDYSAAEIFLDDIDTDLIPVKGTAIGIALRESLKAFEGGSHKSRAVILITDGEDHSGEALAVAEEAKAAGVRVFTIGIGKDQGSPIPMPGGGFHKDRSGEMVLSRLDETTLQKIALATGGSYVRSVTGDVDLEKIYDQGIKATLEDQELASKRRKRWEERFQWMVALALILLVLEPFIRERRRVAPAATALLLLTLPTIAAAQAPAPPVAPLPPAPPPAAAPAMPPAQPSAPAPTQAPPSIDNPYRAYEAGQFDQALQGFVDEQVDHPQDPAVMMNIGAAHYQMKSYEEAEKAFGQAALLGDDPLRARAFYNLGNVAYRQGRLDEAIKLYQAALELDPDDPDAKFNIEFVRDEIRRRHEEAKKQQQQQQDEQQQCDNPQAGNNSQAGEQPDRDKDGLSDQLEQSAENQTDPDNRDSDGDGLADGDEDRNRNGRVDENETDPNKKDSDGDGTPDGQEQQPAEAQPEQPEQQPEGMTQEQADRYLQALEEDRPDDGRKVRGARRARPAKDW